MATRLDKWGSTTRPSDPSPAADRPRGGRRRTRARDRPPRVNAVTPAGHDRSRHRHRAGPRRGQRYFAHGQPGDLMWIVTVLDPGGGPGGADLRPDRRLELVRGDHRDRRRQAGAAKDRGPIRDAGRCSSADPTAFDSAPVSVLGITVRDIATLMRDRQATRATWAGTSSRSAPGTSARIRRRHATPPRQRSIRQRRPAMPRATGFSTGRSNWPPRLVAANKSRSLATGSEPAPPDRRTRLTSRRRGSVAFRCRSPSSSSATSSTCASTRTPRTSTSSSTRLAWRSERPNPIGHPPSVTRLSSSGTEDPAAVLARDRRPRRNDRGCDVGDPRGCCGLRRPRTREPPRIMPEFTSGSPRVGRPSVDRE